MRALLFGVAMALTLAVPAWAEDAAAAKPVDSHLAAALDVLEANGSVTNLPAMLDVLAPIQAQEIHHQQPNLSAEQIAALQAAIKNEFVSRLDELKKLIAAGYAAHFSEDELHTLAAFYRSDVGRKYVTTVPVMMKELAPAEMAWAVAMAGDALRKFSAGVHDQGVHT